jgi:hypothetical protein
MVLSIHFQYSKEEQAGRRFVTLCAAILDCGCASPKFLQQQDETGIAKANVGIFFDIF